MGLLDQIFHDEENEKDGFTKTMDGLLDKAVSTVDKVFMEPQKKKIDDHFDQVSDLMTNSLKRMIDGFDENAPAAAPDPEIANLHGTERVDAQMPKWDAMIDQVINQELGRYRICPVCHKENPAGNQYCAECGAKLPEETLADVICPACGAKNRFTDQFCTACGKPLPRPFDTAEKHD